jgi:hypothetical protein
MCKAASFWCATALSALAVPSVAQDDAKKPEAKKPEAKAHEWAGKKDRGNETAPTLGVGSRFLETTTRLDRLMTLEELACRADAVVTGTVISRESNAGAGAVIYTNYLVEAEETIRTRGKPSARVVVTRVGGELPTETGKRTFRSRLLPPLEVGQKYLLFLTRVPDSPKAFAAEIPGGAIRISGDPAQPLAESIDEVAYAKGVPRRGAAIAAKTLTADLRKASRVCATPQ